MFTHRARIENPMRSTFGVVLALVSLLLGSFDFHSEHELQSGISAPHEAFEAAAHPYAPLHMESAGVATWRHSCPACLHLLRSIGADPVFVVTGLELDDLGAPAITDTPRLAPRDRSPLVSRGPPGLLA